MSTKLVFLHICRATGIFHLARLLHRGNLRILCYHGYSLDDEHEYRRQLFITGSTFRERMRYLRRKGYEAYPLGAGLSRLRDGTLPPDSFVVTIDDGFFGVKAVADPILREFEVPYTIYVTTYYCLHENPIFRLAVTYMLWKTGRRPDLDALGVPGADSALMRDGSVFEGETGAVVRHGELELDEVGRVDLARRLAAQVGADYESLRRTRRMSLLTASEVRELADSGVDIQLHTHTHRFPADATEARAELVANARELADMTSVPLDHFCYPSGRWAEEHFDVLEEQGIVSATTTDLGLAARDDHPYALRRIMDSEAVPQIVFESEICGLASTLRKCKKFVFGLLGRTVPN